MYILLYKSIKKFLEKKIDIILKNRIFFVNLKRKKILKMGFWNFGNNPSNNKDNDYNNSNNSDDFDNRSPFHRFFDSNFTSRDQHSNFSSQSVYRFISCHPDADNREVLNCREENILRKPDGTEEKVVNDFKKQRDDQFISFQDEESTNFDFDLGSTIVNLENQFQNFAQLMNTMFQPMMEEDRHHFFDNFARMGNLANSQNFNEAFSNFRQGVNDFGLDNQRYSSGGRVNHRQTKNSEMEILQTSKFNDTDIYDC